MNRRQARRAAASSFRALMRMSAPCPAHEDPSRDRTTPAPCTCRPDVTDMLKRDLAGYARAVTRRTTGEEVLS